MNFDKRGLIGTIVFHIIILALFIFYGFRTPLPLPDEAGILINFGDADYGSGPEEPDFNDEPLPQPVEEVVEETVEEPVEEAPIMTQNTEEAPAVETKKPVEKKPQPKQEKTEEKKVEKKPEPKKEEKPVIDPRSLYSGRKNNPTYTGPQGNTSGEGNQGSPAGDTEADNYGPGGGTGDRPGFYLDGRNALSLPRPNIQYQKTGKVVVQIKVDRDGNVVEATPGVKGSTTLDSYLLGVAKKAALSSKFDSNPNAAYYQTGTITYIFRVK